MKNFKWAFVGILWLFFMIVIWNTHTNKSIENSWLYDCNNLTARKPGQAAVGLNRYGESGLYANFSGGGKGVIVSASGVRLREVEYKEFIKNPKPDAFGRLDQVLLFMPETVEHSEVKVYMPRKIVQWAGFPVIGLILLLALALWRDVKTHLSADHTFPFSREQLFYLFIGSIPVFLMWQNILDGPVISGGGDAGGYLSLSRKSLFDMLASMRTPGYPVFLSLVECISPVSYQWTGVLQYGIFLGSEVFLVWQLFRFRLPLTVCIALWGIFLPYMESFHWLMLADSLGVSGIILLVGCSLFWIYAVRIKNPRQQYIGALLLTTVCFFQLMVKPFPTTILIPCGLAFLMFFRQYPFRKTVLLALIPFLLGLIPAFGFCTYRYWKFDNFNFASIANISLAVQNIVMSPPEILDSDVLPPEVHATVKEILTRYNNHNANLKWPVDFTSPKFNNNAYRQYVGRLWFHDGFGNYYIDQYRRPDTPKIHSQDVWVDNACAPVAKSLMRHVPLETRLIVARTYAEILQQMIVDPGALAGKPVQLFSPFGGKLRFGLFLILPMLLLAALCYLRKRYDIPWKDELRLNRELCIIWGGLIFLAPILFFSSCFVIAPFCEFRREMIGLWGLFFGGIGLAFYLWYLCLFGFLHFFRWFPKDKRCHVCESASQH